MSKTFSSKTLDHLGSYSIVQSAKSYVLSYRYFAILATYSVALINYTQDNVVARFPLALDLLKFSDTKFDSLVLSNIDDMLASEHFTKAEETFVSTKQHVENVVSAYKTKGAQIYSALYSRVQSIVSPYQEKAVEYSKNAQSVVGDYKKKGEETVSTYLRPLNNFAVSTVDKVLPKSKKVAENTKAGAENELAKSIEIVNDTFERSKDLLTSKSSEVTNVVLSTYHKEFELTPEKNYYVKVASASVNTGVALLKNVNSDYIQPLKETTQTYVQETITHTEEKAEELAAETTKTVENVSVQLNGSSNGAIPVVSASA
ncbi:hypothetical protein OXX59_006537 [Metschnikowia pulcherrima]